MPNTSLRRNRRRAVVVGAAAAVTLPLVAAAATAAVPDASGAFHGCYLKTTGVLRVIDPASSSTARNHCKTTERAISWNEQGPQGLPGADGAQGPEGPAGVQGPAGEQGPAGSGAGLSGVELVQEIFTVPPTIKGPLQAEMACGPGKVVLTPGYQVTLGTGSVTLVSSSPIGTGGWEFIFRGGSTGGSVHLSLLCADGTPA
jgi:hypothetical protein